MSKTVNCLFCNKLEGHVKEASRLMPWLNPSKFIISQTKNLLLTYELFPIDEDPYFLIVPKKHTTSFSQIKQNVDLEIRQLLDDLRDLYKKKNIIVFEHGEQVHGRKAQSIYHAHIHVLLTNKNYFPQMKKELKKLEIPFQVLAFNNSSTQSILKQHASNHSYLLFRENNKGIFVLKTPELAVFSQFFRILMNKINNQRPFINWKSYSEEEAEVIKTRLNSIIYSTSIDTATGILAIDKNQNILLLKSKKEFGRWVVPGGHLQYGESIENCAKRSLKEKTGLSSDNITFFQTQESLTERLDVLGDKVIGRHFIFLNCLAKIKLAKPKVKLDDDKTEYVWINPVKALKDLQLNAATQKFIRKYVKSL